MQGNEHDWVTEIDHPTALQNSDKYHSDPEDVGFLHVPYRIKAALDSATGGPPESGVKGESSQSTGVPKRGSLFQGKPTCFLFYRDYSNP